jgi:hypothetical protein
VKRPVGRPPLDHDDPSVPVSLRMPSKQFEDVCERAKADRMTMAEWIRHMLRSGAAENRKQK